MFYPFSVKFFSFNLECLADPIWNIGFEPNPEIQKFSLHDRWVSGIRESGLAKVKVSRSLVRRNFFVCPLLWHGSREKSPGT